MTDTLLGMKDVEKELHLRAEEVLEDYRLAYKSRQVSMIGRREVLSGKAKFGIFGDGKEITQIAMSKVFQKGDFRSGYYRDQNSDICPGRDFYPGIVCPAIRPYRRSTPTHPLPVAR